MERVENIPAITRTASARRFRAPPWLLIPVGLELFRLSLYQGNLWWLFFLTALLVDFVLLLVLVRLADRYPLGRGRFGDVWRYAIVGIVFVATTIGVQEAVFASDHSAAHPNETLLHSVLSELGSFLVWTGVAHAIVYLRRYHAAEAHSLRLRLDLAGAARKHAEAELRSFENELNPRFLIGALRSASELVKSDPVRSERLLIEIGEVVRAARPVARSTRLGDEIDALQPFLNLERERLGQNIVLTSDVEGDLLDEPLPPLVLPALVREALRATSDSGAIAIDVTAAPVTGRDGGQLQVDVTCSQEGLKGSRATKEDGVLSRTIEHLRSAYEGEAVIDVARIDTGIRVRLTIPLESDGSADQDSPAEDETVPTLPTPRPWRTLPMGLVLFFAAVSALNINTTLHRPRMDGLIPPASLAIPEAFLGAVPSTLILFVATRLRGRGLSAQLLGLHAGVAVALGLLNAVLKWSFITAAGYPYPPFTIQEFALRTLAGIMIYSLSASVIGAFEYARRFRTAETKGLRLQAELAEADRRRIDSELRALKAELNPHFLGNALTGAASLMRTDPAAARDVLAGLADAVGSVVSRIGTQEVTLQEEIESVAPFIAVEQSRFGDRLSVHWNVDEDARGARVPHLILQPLVENAVKHGLAAPSGGRIIVGGRRAGERLELTVQDDGVGIEQAKRARGVRRGGIGLSNSRARLAQLYGSEADLQLVPAPQSGTIVKVTLPWR